MYTCIYVYIYSLRVLKIEIELKPQIFVYDNSKTSN